MTPKLVLKKVGFTGTRRGMSERQKVAVRARLVALFRPGAEFHHGVCKGADVEAAEMAREVGYRTVGHPPTIGVWRDDSWVDDERRLAKPYRARNRDIVDEVGVLLAAPGADPKRGGTWMTIGIAERAGRKTEIIDP